MPLAVDRSTTTVSSIHDESRKCCTYENPRRRFNGTSERPTDGDQIQFARPIMAASNPIDTTIFVTSPVPCRPRITTASRNTPKSGALTLPRRASGTFPWPDHLTPIGPGDPTYRISDHYPLWLELDVARRG